jgi:hypothetical protein
LIANSAYSGGAANSAILNSCTIVGNTASFGGGVHNGALGNCIVYFNTAQLGGENYWNDDYIDPDYQTIALDHCCTTPLPADGKGNISEDPQLSDLIHLSSTSPCRGAGSTNYLSNADIDGKPWASPPSIGCDEYEPGAKGTLEVTIIAKCTNAVPGFGLSLRGAILGHASSNRWDFGDGAITDGPVWNRFFYSVLFRAGCRRFDFIGRHALWDHENWLRGRGPSS